MKSIAKDVADKIDRTRAATFALLQNWTGTLEGEAKSLASWNDRTGHARQSIHAGVEQSGDRFTLYLSHGMEYGEILEKGTKPHIIRPRDKKALYWHGAAHPMKLVRHPGTRSYAVVGPTIDANERRIMNTVNELWRGE